MKHVRCTAVLLALVLGAGVGYSQTRKGKPMKNQARSNVEIYLACDRLTELTDVSVLVDGKVIQDKELQFKGLYPCIDTIMVKLTPGPHEILVRSLKLSCSRSEVLTIKPGKDWITIAPQPAAMGGAWEWIVNHHDQQPKFS